MNEIERRALEERRTSPRYARYRFLKGFKDPSGGRVRAGVGHGEVARAVQGRG